MFVFAAGYSPAVNLRDPSLIALNQAVAGPDGTPSPAYGPYATEEVRWRGENPLDLSENLRGMTLSLRTGNGQPGGEFGGSGDPIEESVHRMATEMHERLDELGIAHVFEDYGAGSHAWPYWQRDLRLDLPTIMGAFADPPPPPRRFSFLSIDPRYEAYRWQVRTARPELEFSRLAVSSPKRFRLAGSGTAVVRTPPRFRPSASYRATIRGAEDARQRLILHASRSGTLRIPLNLGPANPDQQYTPEAQVNGTDVFTTRVRIKRPMTRLRSMRAPALAISLCALALLPATADAEGRCGDPATRPWCDTNLSPDKRAELLLAELTARREDLAARRR